MSKNIEINIQTSSNTYEALYPVTDYTTLLNKPTIPTVPSLPLSVSNGGTGVTSYSSLASQLSSYISAGGTCDVEFKSFTGNGNSPTVVFSNHSGKRIYAIAPSSTEFVKNQYATYDAGCVFESIIIFPTVGKGYGFAVLDTYNSSTSKETVTMFLNTGWTLSNNYTVKPSQSSGWFNTYSTSGYTFNLLAFFGDA